MNTPRDNLAIALDALAKGFAPVPCHPGTKQPMVKWKEWQTKLPPEQLVRQWFTGVRANIALVVTGLVVFDIDDPAKVSLVLKGCGDTPHRLKTPRGVHLGYRRRLGVALNNQVKIKGQPIDIRTNGGLEMIPASETEHGHYEWIGEGLLSRSALPLAKIGWTRTRTRKRTREVATGLEPSRSDIKNPEAYCLCITSIQGSNGSAGLVRAVCVLRDAGRTWEQAMDFLFHVWNPRCADPPWSEAEIRHAIRRHYRIAEF